MKEKSFYENDELDKDIADIKSDVELLKGYDDLIKKVKELKENKG